MWLEVLIVLIKVLFFITCILTLTSLLTWQERKQSAVMQDRLGANRAQIFGIRAFGLMHIFSDALKMFFKEDYVPPGGDKVLHTAAPIISLFFALMTFAAIPFGDTLRIAGHTIELQILPLNVGILFVFAMMSLAVYGTFFAGFSSNNKFAFLGGLRASSQMISYEITMGATLIGLLMIFGTLDLAEINRAQGGLLWGWLPKWGVILQPIGFLLFVTAGMAETKRIPFDLPEGESEIIGYFIGIQQHEIRCFLHGGFHRDDPDRRAHYDPVFWRMASPVSSVGRIPSPMGVVLRPAAPSGRAAPVCRFRHKGVLLLLVPAFDTLDTAALSLRPAHAARLEIYAAHLHPEHIRYSASSFVD